MKRELRIMKKELRIRMKNGGLEAGTLELSVGRVVVMDKLFSKPPWQRFMDLNVDMMKWLAGNRIVRGFVGKLIWEIGKWLLGFRRHPAEAGQV